MKWLKKIPFFILTASVFLLIGSTTRAGVLTDKVQETYQKIPEFKARFTQKTKIELLDRQVTESGSLTFQKPGLFVIHYQGDKERKYLSDGKTLWVYRPADREVEVYEQLKDVLSKEALAFLGGLGELSQEFRVEEKGKDTLFLTPKSKNSPFRKLQLKIDVASGLAVAVTLFPKSGNESYYVFSEIQTEGTSPKKFFEFHEKNVSIVRP